MNSKFIKNFNIEGQLSNLPDSDYWLSREELILTYLNQRGASVPKVQMKDLVRKSLTLQNVGTSLDIYFNEEGYPEVDKASALKIYLDAIILLEELLSLGVLHLDVALRNIATPNLDGQEIYILDFIHALASHSALQKPLPLLPTEGLHHPALLNALNTDWENYFKFFGVDTPKLDSTLSISNEEFSRYWIDFSAVQSLCENHPILAHGLGNLALELSKAKNIDASAREIFRGFSDTLCNLDSKDSYLRIADVKSSIASALNSDPAEHKRQYNATPIPRVHSKYIEINPTTEIGIIGSLPTFEVERRITIDPKDEGEKNSPTLISNIQIDSLKFSSSYSLGNFLLCWTLILLNIYLIDSVVRYRRVILADEIILLIILIGVIAPFTLLISLFSGGARRIKIQSFAAFLAVATELLVIGSYPNATYSSFLSWLPSCAIGFFAFLLSVSNKKAK
jgi:hypothetical protein